MTPSSGLAVGLTALALSLPLSIAGINLSAAVITLFVLLLPSAGRPPAWRAAMTPTTVAMLAYLAVAVVSALAGIDSQRSLGLLYKDFHKLWLLVAVLLAFTHAGRAYPATAMAAGGAIAGATGLLQALSPDELGRWWVRAHGFVHPVVFGNLMALLWLGALCALAQPPAGWVRRQRWIGAWFALLSAALLLNQTRGAFLAIAAGVAAVAPLDTRLRRWSARLLGAAVVVFVIWELMPTGRSLIGGALRHGLAPIANQQFDRLILWKVAWQIFLDHPWLGVGPHNYHTMFGQYFEGVIQTQRIWGSAHNLYLHQLAERGLVGFVALCWLLGALTVRAAERARKRRDALSLWSFACAVAFLAMNLTEVAFQNEQVMSLFVFIWCWAEARSRQRAP